MITNPVFGGSLLLQGPYIGEGLGCGVCASGFGHAVPSEGFYRVYIGHLESCGVLHSLDGFPSGSIGMGGRTCKSSEVL